MDNNEIKNWFKLLYDELPNIVRPLFSLSIFLVILLIAGGSLKLNDSLWLITKEGIFNLAFYLGFYSLIFRALNKAPLEFQKSLFLKKYPIDKLNEDYFLGQYKGSDKVFVFELNKANNKKLWIENLPTKHQLWPGIDATQLKVDQVSIKIGKKIINLNQYNENVRQEDGKIDVLNPGQIDNFVLAIMSLVISLGVLALF
ncbi:MAG: hypothetical protein ACD_13C00197G0007 [uncultured bacterium]|uniref:Uncharacterized protein n=1 Tax=Candidatus Woesebacteria bacterium GW2011_GWA1_40_43 TaxID=1618553 RepID=A0A0G0SES7_9BACT|nr:MAG: hypothetical protein ACD_13C00197G0007 [uncultured bacterium]KKR53322.1 MAG: hypothetical protein UT88_C0011G0018 [Candidatus Woesebacteria bacterium GW2011_GWD2_40_19]KKR58339.1 MAG: hypothetical protein UT96_C0007G0006 [Candidatus Woesebacteria bacterium GW2011_GWC2_40_30]KKR63463.1 MAG: hypothetical protein UU02_C0024G0006 [Candidatus Woesebacteria bacterium GW2011_GWA1_40_43]HAU65232.1 hypothetical protein [Candidatus Woesebacteria bacterium]